VYRAGFWFFLDFLVTYAPFLVIAVPEPNERKSVPLWEEWPPWGRVCLPQRPHERMVLFRFLLRSGELDGRAGMKDRIQGVPFEKIRFEGCRFRAAVSGSGLR
jgi:hypothetical protein